MDISFKIGGSLVSDRYLPKMGTFQTDEKAINITARTKYFMEQCYLVNAEERIFQYLSKYRSLHYHDVSSIEN